MFKTFVYNTDFLVLLSQESNGPTDAYAAISNADRLQAEPESLRKWREEQSERLEVLGKSVQSFFFFLSECGTDRTVLDRGNDQEVYGHVCRAMIPI